MVVSQLLNKVVRRGERPTIPPTCPAGLASLIRACWHQDPKQRPPFHVVLETLQSMRDLPKVPVPWVCCSYCAEQARA